MEPIMGICRENVENGELSTVLKSPPSGISHWIFFEKFLKLVENVYFIWKKD